MIWIVFLIGLLSCVKDNTPVIPLNNTVDTTNATAKHDGNFMNGPYGCIYLERPRSSCIYFKRNNAG